jgi:hypothetical protein
MTCIDTCDYVVRGIGMVGRTAWERSFKVFFLVVFNGLAFLNHLAVCMYIYKKDNLYRYSVSSLSF